MEVDLSALDPTELTEAQAEQLVEAALERSRQQSKAPQRMNKPWTLST